MPYYYHAKFGGDWTTNKEEMEGAEVGTPAWIGLIKGNVNHSNSYSV